MTLLNRLVALERDHGDEATRLIQWFERTLERRAPDLDPDEYRAVIAELCEADRTLEARHTAAYQHVDPDRWARVAAEQGP